MATPTVLFHWFKEMDDRGQFGDQFGAANALFTGLALIGAIYAILLQSEELELQREELKETNRHFRTQNDLVQAQITAARAVGDAAEAKERFSSNPYFRFGVEPDPEDINAHNVRIRNIGADIYEFVIYYNQSIPSVLDDDFWMSGEDRVISIEDNYFHTDPLRIRIEYHNRLGENHQIAYQYRDERFFRVTPLLG